MKNFLIGLFAGLFVAGLTGIILVFVVIKIASSLGDRKPTVAEGSTLILKLEGAVPEKAQALIRYFKTETPLGKNQAVINAEVMAEVQAKAAVQSGPK